MILNDIQIKHILEVSMQIPQWVVEARVYSKTLKALVLGENFEEELCKISGKEDNDKLKARKKYARSTKDLFHRVFLPADNIYSATGGSKYYGKDTGDLIKRISTVRDGKSLEVWLQKNWFNNLYKTDPNGIILYEWTDKKFYPTSKSIFSIRNYESNGQNLEWILFEPWTTGGKTYFRLIDDAFDYTFEVTENGYIKADEFTYVNIFKEVPGVINSDLTTLGSEIRKSSADEVLEIAQEFLRDSSIKNVFKNLHGYPVFWRYALKCNKCHGAGKDDKGKDCVDCNGMGYYINKDITDMAILPLPTDSDSVKIAPDIAGYIAPDLKTWEQYNLELALLEMLITETLWGASIKKEGNETATGKYIDTQPVINKLNVFADVCQWVEWKLTDLGVKFYYPEKENNVSILYGRNYIIEPVSILLDRYQKSREKGDNAVILDKQFAEILTAKYKHDPLALSCMLKKSKVEPYLHYTLKEIFDVFGREEAQEKMLFYRWWQTLEYDFIVNSTEETLNKLFYAWFEENKKVVEPIIEIENEDDNK